ncbi:MAG: hypothetical protein R3301_05795 [Saprospiraceae bacterium]|nr:hypothetical protein [Saprospiraceae bacterium]
MATATDHTTPKTFTIPLIERVGSIGQVLSEFLDVERSAIQDELNQEFSNVPGNAVDMLLNAFVTADGTKKPLKLEEIQLHQLTREQLLFCLGRLERGRILRLDDDTYELAHDTLAGHIHGQRSAEEIGLLEASSLVKNRWKDYEKTQTLMNAKEVDLVSIYIGGLEERQIISAEELAFVRRSMADVRRKRVARRITVAAIMFILGLTTVWALIQQSRARQATVIAQEATLDAQNRLTALERQTFLTDSTSYEGLLASAEDLMDNDPPDYAGATQLLVEAEAIAKQSARDIDNGGLRARLKRDTAENRIPLRDEFDQLMERALRLENEGYHRYMAALAVYRQALALDYNNRSAKLSIDLLTDKLPIAFESLRKDGDIYFDAAQTVNERQAYVNAHERYRQAAAIPASGVDRDHVLNRIRKCEEILN